MVLTWARSNTSGSMDPMGMCHALCHRFPVISQIGCLRRVVCVVHRLVPPSVAHVLAIDGGDAQTGDSERTGATLGVLAEDDNSCSDKEGDDIEVIAYCTGGAPKYCASGAKSTRNTALRCVWFVAEHLASPLFVARIVELRKTTPGKSNRNDTGTVQYRQTLPVPRETNGLAPMGVRSMVSYGSSRLYWHRHDGLTHSVACPAP